MADSVDPSRVPKPLSGPFESERERTIEMLTRSFEHGDMTVEEYDERLELASTASTGAELEVLVADLSKLDITIPASSSTPLEFDSVSTVFGNKNRQGPWRLAKQTRVSPLLGTIRLDLGDVEWPDSKVEVICRPIFGTIVLRVPPDVQLEIVARALFGDVDNRVHATGVHKTKTLVVKGRVIFGSLRIETVYPKGIGRK